MGFWALNQRQIDVMKREIKGASVYDVGCGDASLSLWCLRNGASKVTGIDSHLKYQAFKVINLGLSDLVLKQGYFDETEPIKADVGLLSWPFNLDQIDFVKHLKKCRTIIFVGNVFDGSCCGNPELFKWLSTRRLSKRIPGNRNSMLVYRNRREKRSFCPEENAVWNWEHIHPHPDSLYPLDVLDCNSVI